MIGPRRAAVLAAAVGGLFTPSKDAKCYCSSAADDGLLELLKCCGTVLLHGALSRVVPSCLPSIEQPTTAWEPRLLLLASVVVLIGALSCFACGFVLGAVARTSPPRAPSSRTPRRRPGCHLALVRRGRSRLP